MSERHRLTITVTVSLYEELCELAGRRRISQWMEDAAWRKIGALRGGQAPTVLVDESAAVEASPIPELPPPPWCWSPLRQSATPEEP